MRHLNYNHLQYFWTVAREGGVGAAARRLHLTPQTISGQLRLLEDSVGTPLFERRGRHLILTDTGRLVFDYADEIFRLGEELREVVSLGSAAGRLRVGIVEAMPKLVAYRLLSPALQQAEAVRVSCREGSLSELAGALSTHELDLILSDAPLGPELAVRGFNHLLGETGTTVFAEPKLSRRLKRQFPRSLDRTPVLLPGRETALRRDLEHWFDRLEIQPEVIGEFDDTALLKAFGQAGAGAFFGPQAIEIEIRRQYHVAICGHVEELRSRFYAISPERRIKHPAVAAIQEQAGRELFSDS